MDDGVIAANVVGDEVARRVPDDVRDLLAQELDRPGCVTHTAVDGPWDVCDRRVQVLLGLSRLGLGPPSRGDVEAMAVKGRPSGGVYDRDGLVIDPKDRSVQADHAVLAGVCLGLARRLGMLGQNPFPVVRVHEAGKGTGIARPGIGRQPESCRAADGELGHEHGHALRGAVGKNEELLEARPGLDRVCNRRSPRRGRLGLRAGRHRASHSPRSRPKHRPKEGPT